MNADVPVRPTAAAGAVRNSRPPVTTAGMAAVRNSPEEAPVSMPADVQLAYAAAGVRPRSIPFDVEYFRADGVWLAEAPLAPFLEYAALVLRPLRVREPRKMAIAERSGAVSLMYDAARLDRAQLEREIPHEVDTTSGEPRAVLELETLLTLAKVRAAPPDPSSMRRARR